MKLKYFLIFLIFLFYGCQQIEKKQEKIDGVSLKEKIVDIISKEKSVEDLNYQTKEIPKLISIAKEEEKSEISEYREKTPKGKTEEHFEEIFSEELYQIPENIKFVAPSEINKEIEKIFKNIYFDYDSYEIRKSEQETLIKIGEYLLNNKEIVVLIEGHCDERGTREYNLVLGEQRALSVRNFLINFGVSPKRLFTVSYGEDKPSVLGSNETSWAKNRRCEFKIGIEKK
ncbi:MAG: peptidoglycan-associated lipoprotein Pal [Candidatus Omnitrophica bacterium]|nr:peptidoglycan-associated lipoprotein Pal [Candidatus Omnitrophota bacterium]MCM8803348.1 peptidoglycan-associated lipoprotein Pal [Candidatus Omnitrophota bacterium]